MAHATSAPRAGSCAHPLLFFVTPGACNIVVPWPWIPAFVGMTDVESNSDTSSRRKPGPMDTSGHTPHATAVPRAASCADAMPSLVIDDTSNITEPYPWIPTFAGMTWEKEKG